MILKKVNWQVLFLITIFVLSLLLRLWQQPKYPSCFHRDEIQFGYNAYSILKTARDEWGQFFPLHFKFNGEYHVPVVFYLISMVMLITGPINLAIRLPAIILGSLTPIVAFYFVRQLLNNKKIGYFLSVLLAFNPWQLINSRGSGEISIISLFFGLLGFTLLFSFMKNKKKVGFLIALISFVLAYFSYIASRLDIPLLLSAFLIIFAAKLKFKKKQKLALVLLLTMPFLLVAFYSKRFTGTSIVAKKFFPENAQEKRVLDGLWQQNKAKFLLTQSKELFFEFTDNYFDYLSPHYIFRNLGEPDRTNIFQAGSLYLIEFFSLILGFFALCGLKQKKQRLFIIFWLLLSPIVGALTYNFPDRPNTARTVYFYFGLSLISSMGLGFLWQTIKHKKIRIAVFVLISLAFFFNAVFVFKQVVYSDPQLASSRNCGYLELFQLTERMKHKFNRIYIGTEYEYPYVFYLWQTKYPPQKYQQFLATTPESNQPVLLNTPDKRNWQLGQYIFQHRSCLINREEGALLAANFNQCKEKYQTRVLKDDHSQRLLFLLPESKDYDVRRIVFEYLGDIKDINSQAVFNLYTYKKQLDKPISEKELEFFVPVD